MAIECVKKILNDFPVIEISDGAEKISVPVLGLGIDRMSADELFGFMKGSGLRPATLAEHLTIASAVSHLEDDTLRGRALYAARCGVSLTSTAVSFNGCKGMSVWDRYPANLTRAGSRDFAGRVEHLDLDSLRQSKVLGCLLGGPFEALALDYLASHFRGKGAAKLYLRIGPSYRDVNRDGVPILAVPDKIPRILAVRNNNSHGETGLPELFEVDLRDKSGVAALRYSCFPVLDAMAA